MVNIVPRRQKKRKVADGSFEPLPLVSGSTMSPTLPPPRSTPPTAQVETTPSTMLVLSSSSARSMVPVS